MYIRVEIMNYQHDECKGIIIHSSEYEAITERRQFNEYKQVCSSFTQVLVATQRLCG